MDFSFCQRFFWLLFYSHSMLRQLPENKHLEEHIHNGSIKAMIEKQERDIIRKYLVSLGSARKVASQVGLSHTTVLNKIKQYHLEHLLSRNKK